MAIDLSELQKKNLQELEAETDKNAVVTAFLITQTPEGQWVAHVDFKDMDLTMDRVATFDDIVAGAANIQAGATVQQTAMMTLHLMDQRAQMMQQQMLQQQDAQRAASLIDPTKLRSKLA
jgi:uncharacterized protein with beta-barrel porin domain